MKWVSYTRSISSRIGEENSSNTIAEQNERIARYLKKCGCSVSEKYSDRKRTAEATEGFDKLVQDGMARKFDAVVVDSIFRCGRTLPFAIEALQRTFYPLGIQFAVVEDDFCSADKTAEEVAEYFNGKTIDKIRSEFITNALDVVNQGMQEKQSITVRCMDIEDLEKQAEAIRVEQIKLYESYADGVLRRDAYIEKKKALSEKLAALQDSIRTEKEEQECADELDEEIRALTKQASEKTYIGGLTKECVDAFVSMVYLYDDQTMKVEFNCEDVIRRALEKYGA